MTRTRRGAAVTGIRPSPSLLAYYASTDAGKERL